MNSYKIKGKIINLSRQSQFFNLIFVPIFALKKMIDHLRNYFPGRIFLKKLKSNKKKNESIFVLFNSIGDTLYGLSLLDAYKKTNENRSITIIGFNKRKNLISKFKSYDKLVLLEEQDEAIALSFLQVPFLIKKGIKVHIYATVPMFYNIYPKYKWKYGNIYYLKKQYGLQLNSSLNYHTNKNNVENMPRKKVAIINPYSVALDGRININIFDDIVAKLKKENYLIYTNVIGNQRELNGTIRLECSLDELYDICLEALVFISIRSGIIDFVVPSDINVFAIYDGCKEKFENLYALKFWECKGKIFEAFANKSSSDEIKKYFIDFLENIGGN